MVGLSSVYVNTCDEYCGKNCEDDCDARACNCDLDKSLIHIHDILAAIKAICIVSIASRIMRCIAFVVNREQTINAYHKLWFWLSVQLGTESKFILNYQADAICHWAKPMHENAFVDISRQLELKL